MPQPAPTEALPEPVDLLIVGAGPAGLHAACVGQDLGLTHRIVDRRGLAHSFVGYPETLRFFSPPDEMSVGGVPFPTRGGEKPAREDILPYFRAVAAYRNLNLSLWELVIDAQRESELFVLTTRREPNGDAVQQYAGRFLLLASGVWDVSRRLECPGASLPHVHHRFHEPTEYFGMPVLVVGGGNSAVYAALSLAEAHASVTFAMRRQPTPYQSHLRPFVVRDLEFAVNEKRVQLHAGVAVAAVEAETAWLQPIEYDAENPDGGRVCGERYSVPARFVFALLGQQADTTLFQRLGMCVERDGRPARNPETYETHVPNAFVCGSLSGADVDVIVAARPQVERVVAEVARRVDAARRHRLRL